MDNQLSKINYKVHPDANVINEAMYAIQETCPYKFIYSYIIYTEPDIFFKDINNLRIQLNISSVPLYNTIELKTAVDGIEKICVNELANKTGKKVIGYKQPPIEIMLEAYDNLVLKLAKTAAMHWQQLEYEDLCQTCRLVMCNLYNKGYYLNKSLVEKSFNNAVLCSIRKDKMKPIIISFESLLDNKDDSNLSIKDTLINQDLENENYDKENDNWNIDILKELQIVLGALITQRQLDQLLREYSTKNVTPLSAKKIQTIKHYLARNKITLETLYDLCLKGE